LMHCSRMKPFSLVACLLVLIPLAVAEASKPADRYSAEVAVAWFDLLYEVVKAEHLSPPVAARVYGLAGVTLYEAVVPDARRHRSVVDHINGLSALPHPRPGKTYHWPTVATSALAAVIPQLLPNASATSLTAIATLEQHFASRFQSPLSRRRFTRSVTQG